MLCVCSQCHCQPVTPRGMTFNHTVVCRIPSSIQGRNRPPGALLPSSARTSTGASASPSATPPTQSAPLSRRRTSVSCSLASRRPSQAERGTRWVVGQGTPSPPHPFPCSHGCQFEVKRFFRHRRSCPPAKRRGGWEEFTQASMRRAYRVYVGRSPRGPDTRRSKPGSTPAFIWAFPSSPGPGCRAPTGCRSRSGCPTACWRRSAAGSTCR